MITIEWKRLLEGKEPFEDMEVEQVAKYLLNLISNETDPIKVIEYTNDLEELLGKGEWLARKYNRLNKSVREMILTTEERSHVQNKMVKVEGIQDEVVGRIKSKYGLP